MSQKKCEEPHAFPRGRQRFIIMLFLSNEDAKFPSLAATSHFDGIQMYVCIYPVAVELNYPDTQVKLLPVIRGW